MPLRTRTQPGVLAAALCVLLVFPYTALAQGASGSIAGNVKDASAAVLPGVTVEVASPALIEKVRTTVTDGQGNYKITELRPGVYSVTFTLTGFSVVKRQGIELSAGFTAPVNAELTVGSVQETITVTGAAPIVDVQSVRTQQVFKSDVLDALPSAQRDLPTLASLTLGATATTAGRNDVGGDKGEASTGLSIHGGRGDDGRTNWDGMNANTFFGGAGGQQRTYKFNTQAVAELVVETSGNSIESETGGANINMVPKEGANRFSLTGSGNFTNTDLSSGSVPSDLIARGTIAGQKTVKKIYDYGVGIGGPIAKDKVWFYATTRFWGSQSFAPNNYFNKATNFYTYVPDLSRPAYQDIWARDFGGRVTWQATSKQKFAFTEHYQASCSCWQGIAEPFLPADPSGTISFTYTPQIVNQVSWNYPATNRLLLQAGLSVVRQPVVFESKGGVDVPGRIRILDVNFPGRGLFQWGGIFNGVLFDNGEAQRQDNITWRFAGSYITGSHAVKTGVEGLRGTFNTRGNVPAGGVDYLFFGGVPILLNQYAGPFAADGRVKHVGAYVSDQWTVRRLTLTAGVRYDHHNVGTLPIDLPAGPFVGARHYDALKNIPNYHDISPRVGVAYDLFGNGKTALRGSWGKFLVGLGGGALTNLAPSNAVVTSTGRPWTDANGNFVPDCVLTNFAANGECGPIFNPGFGSPAPAFTWDANAREGWGVREYNYQWSAAIQQEVRPGFAISAGYYHTEFHNAQIAVNTALSRSSFDYYCVTAPTDSRLGGASGKQVCGITDVNFASKALAPRVVWYRTQDAPLPGLSGERIEKYDGAEVSMNLRFRQAGLISGGLSIGRQIIDNCFANDFPSITGVFPLTGAGSPTVLGLRDASYCTTAAESLWNGIGSQVKFQIVYPLVYDFVVAGTYKHLPGIPIAGTVAYPNAAVVPALGRNLSACAAATGACTQAAQINVVQPGAVKDERLNQVDLRFTRPTRIGSARFSPTLELYNVFNARTPQANATTWGTAATPTSAAVPNSAYLRPSSLLGGRLLKFGAQIDF